MVCINTSAECMNKSMFKAGVYTTQEAYTLMGLKIIIQSNRDLKSSWRKKGGFC
jgi:hypothetical protein